MYTIRLLFFFFILQGIFSCNSDISSEWQKSEPIADSELHAKLGDCLVFSDAAGYNFIGTILAFNKSEGGIWYAITFTNFYDSITPTTSCIDTLKLDARRVPYHGYENFITGFYVTWARDTLIDAHKKILLGNAVIENSGKWEITGEGSVSTFSQFLNSYNFFYERRLTTQEFNKDELNTTFHPDTLITFAAGKEALKNNQIIKSNH
ncbi:hypothetical protein [Ferruginibacter sp.]